MLPSALTWGRGWQHFHSENTFSCGMLLMHLLHHSTFHFPSITSHYTCLNTLWKHRLPFNKPNRRLTKFSWIIDGQYFVSLMRDPSASKGTSLHLSYLWQMRVRPLASAPHSWVTASLGKGEGGNRGSLNHCIGTALPCSHSLTQGIHVGENCMSWCLSPRLVTACVRCTNALCALTAMGLDQTCAGIVPAWGQGSALPRERQANAEADL